MTVSFSVHVCSGFWGLLCVGIFSRKCLIQELYEDLCYCVTSDLPSSVCVTVMHVHISTFVPPRAICAHVHQIGRLAEVAFQLDKLLMSLVLNDIETGYNIIT